MGLPQKSLQRYTCLLAYRQQCSWAVACQRRSGVYDALSAKIAAKAGHKAAFISGYAVRAFPFSCSGAVGAVLPHSVREANCSRARTSRQGIVSPARSSPSRVCSGVSSFPVAGRRSACVTYQFMLVLVLCSAGKVATALVSYNCCRFRYRYMRLRACHTWYQPARCAHAHTRSWLLPWPTGSR